MEELLAEGMDPGGGWGGGKELEQIGLSEGRCGLSTEGGGLLGHTVQLATEAGDLVERRGG